MTGPPPLLHLLYFAGKYFPGSMAIDMHRQILDELAAYHIEATILSLGPTHQREPVRRTQEDGRTVIRVAPAASLLDRLLNAVSKRLVHYDFLLSGMRQLAPVVRAQPGDVALAIMAFPFGTMLAGALTLARRPTPLVIHLAGGDLMASDEADYGYARYATVRRLLDYTFRRATIVRANSTTAQVRALELGCQPERLRVVPSNITTLVLPEAPLANFRAECRARLQARLGLGQGPLLLAVGRLTPIKGFDDIVRALPRLTARWPDLQLLVVGPTAAGQEPYVEALRAEAERHGLGAHLHLVGEVDLDKMRDYYAAADLLIVSSLAEGLNKAGIEAAANGTPSIVTATTGLAEYVEAAGAGLVVPARAPMALAEAITTLLADGERWQACATAAHRLALDFSPAAVARQQLALYVAAAPAAHPWRQFWLAERGSDSLGPGSLGARSGSWR